MITASLYYGDRELTAVTILNPGDCWGKTWLLEIGGSYWSLFLVVEADTVQDAIDKLADNPVYGRLITVPPEDLDDYPEDSRHYGPSGQVLDLDFLTIHGRENVPVPYPCRYHGPGLPTEGLDPTLYPDYDPEGDV